MYVCIGILYKMHYGNVEKKHCMQNTSERGALLVVFILPKKKKKKLPLKSHRGLNYNSPARRYGSWWRGS